MNGSRATVTTSLLIVGLLAGTAVAVNMETVSVGNPGNAADTQMMSDGTTGYGSVGYSYQMGKYEVTAAQYCEFLNAVAQTDTYGLYDTGMADPTDHRYNTIQRNGTSGTYTYNVFSGRANRPVTFVSWGDAARFANWMHNGKPTGAQVLSTTEDGSYYLNGAMSNAALIGVTRKANATWVIPSENEWYKAAYHKNDEVTGNFWDFATSSNILDTTMANWDSDTQTTTDVGHYGNYPSPYGTYDQTGNVWELNEAVLYGSFRGVRGGSFNIDYYGYVSASFRPGFDPVSSGSAFGFRVAYAPGWFPEPATITMLAVASLGILRRTSRSDRLRPA